MTVEVGERVKEPERTKQCRTYWGSHGCMLDADHEGWCICCGPDGDWDTWVGGFPFYGPPTHFYGEDAERSQAKLDAAKPWTEADEERERARIAAYFPVPS